MENIWRWTLVTAIAPITWGSAYLVTHEFLPADHPLGGAAVRALPAGLLLLAIARERPRGAWWWRSFVLGTLNMGAFFALVYVAAQLLPTSVAATIMACSPIVMMLFAWGLAAERPRIAALVGGGLGVAGVALLVFSGRAALDPSGVAASVGAMAMSSLGFILAKRWQGEVRVLSSTAWQLVAGGLVLVPVAAIVEGPMPVLDAPAVAAFAYISLVATAIAYLCWFQGLRHLPAGTVGLLGLLNPVTGVLLGTIVAGEQLGSRQLAGLGLVFAGILLGQPVIGRMLRFRSRAEAPVSG